MKTAWIDVETSGLDPWKNGILQLAIIIEEQTGEIIHQQVLHIRPFDGDKVEESALEVNGFTASDIEGFMIPKDAHLSLTALLDKHVARFDPMDKMVFAGYNANFDNEFVRSFFIKAGDKYYGSYFFSPVLDVMSFVADAIRKGVLAPAKSFKLVDVCERLKVDVVGSAHDALVDIKATREVYEALYAKRGQP